MTTPRRASIEGKPLKEARARAEQVRAAFVPVPPLPGQQPSNADIMMKLEAMMGAQRTRPHVSNRDCREPPQFCFRGAQANLVRD